MHLQPTDARPGRAETGWWREPATMRWGRAGEAATSVVYLWGFRAEGVGGGGGGGGGSADDGGGKCAGDCEPESAAKVASVEEGDGRVDGGGGSLGGEGYEGGGGFADGRRGLGGSRRGRRGDQADAINAQGGGGEELCEGGFGG